MDFPSEIWLPLVVVLDVAALVATVLIATKLARGWLGAIVGIAVEVVRILTAMAIVSNPYNTDDSLAFFADFRLFNIPILVGVGFMAGSAATQKAQLRRVTCPRCKGGIAMNMTILRAKAGASPRVEEACPNCKVVLMCDISTMEIVSSREPTPAAPARQEEGLGAEDTDTPGRSVGEDGGPCPACGQLIAAGTDACPECGLTLR